MIDVGRASEQHWRPGHETLGSRVDDLELDLDSNSRSGLPVELNTHLVSRFGLSLIGGGCDSERRAPIVIVALDPLPVCAVSDTWMAPSHRRRRPSSPFHQSLSVGRCRPHSRLGRQGCAALSLPPQRVRNRLLHGHRTIDRPGWRGSRTSEPQRIYSGSWRIVAGGSITHHGGYQEGARRACRRGPRDCPSRVSCRP